MATTLFLTDTTSGVYYHWENGQVLTLSGGSSTVGVQNALQTSRGSSLLVTTTNTANGPTIVYVGAVGTAFWCSPPLAAGVTISGTITFNIWALESSMNANVAINAWVCRLQPDGTLTSILQTNRTTELGTAAAAANFTGTPTSTAFLKGDRIAVVLFGQDGGGTMGAGFTFSVDYSGPTASADGDTFVTFTETLTFMTTTPTGTTIYPTDSASAVSTASIDKEAWTSRGGSAVTAVTNTVAGPTTPIQVTDTGGGTVIDWFTRPLAAMTLTAPVLATVRGRESASGANATMMIQLYVVNNDGSSPVLWAQNGWSGGTNTNSELNPAGEAAASFWLTADDLAITAGQRLMIRFVIDDAIWNIAQMGTGNTATLYYAGPTGGASGDTFLTFNDTLTEQAAGATSLIVPNPSRILHYLRR